MLNIFKVLKGTVGAHLHEWGQSIQLPMETLLEFLQFNGLVAFVLFNKNNGKLISLSKGQKKKKIRKHNFVKSPSKEFSSLASYLLRAA